MSQAIAKKIESGLRLSKMDDLYLLVKFRLSLMVVASSVLAYFIAAGSSFSWSVFVLLFIGGFGITAAANGINQVLEREFDSLMERTKIRPLAANRMKSSEAVLISGFMLVIGIMCLSFINPVVSFLGMLSFMLYAFVYTPLKRYSTISVAIGAIPGAFPVLIGVVAHDGTLTLLGLTLFMIQFLWQFPHFWAISFLSFDDYNNAGFKLLPKGKDGNIDRNLGAYSAVYSLLIIPTVLIAYYAGLETSMLALGGVILLTLIYTWYAIKMQIDNDRASALKLMFSSFFYLPLVLLLYIIG